MILDENSGSYDNSSLSSKAIMDNHRLRSSRLLSDIADGGGGGGGAGRCVTCDHPQCDQGGSDCNSDSGEHPPPSTDRRGSAARTAAAVAASTTRGIAQQAVRFFGGVIMGAAAEEISRNWGQLPALLSYSAATSSSTTQPYYEDDAVCSEDVSRMTTAGAGRDSTPAMTTSYESQQRRRSLSLHRQAPGARGACSDHRDGSVDEKRPVAGALKRKLSGTISICHTADHDANVITGDATPRAPGGHLAAWAHARGRDCTRFVAECSLPTKLGQFRLRAYRYEGTEKFHEPVVMVAGNLVGRENVPVRVHDQCQTSEVLGSKRCDCREQLDMSLRYIQRNGGGAVIYLAQEGRGIGLANKVAAYGLQDEGLDTVDANRMLGFKDDQRSYECVDFILGDMGVKSIQLMTNNPFKIEWLRATGVNVKGRIPIEVASNEHNHDYLATKTARMSHLINNL